MHAGREWIGARFAAVTRTRTRLATAGIALVALLALVAFGAFSLFKPVERGVLPQRTAPAVQGEFLVKFKPGTSEETKRAQHLRSKATELRKVRGINVDRMKIPPGFSFADMRALYEKDPSVAYVEPNYLVKADDTPNDPALTSAQWNVKKINMPTAWDLAKGSPSMVIAVLDSGIVSTHEDLAGQVISGFNYVTETTNVGDTTGHGTVVSGIAVAVTNNAKGVTSICRLCKVMPIVVLDGTGSGTHADAAAGIIHAADGGAKVINMSFGGSEMSQTLQDAIDYAWSKGAVLVGAAGNAGTPGIEYPAAANNVLAVGGTDSSDNKAAFSNTGPQLDVVAPASGIFSTTIAGGYSNFAGTSYAAPHVAALAGLLWSANPSLTNAEVVNIITSTAVDLGPAGRDDSFGHGRIDALAALNKALGTTSSGGATPTAPSVPPTLVPATATPVPPTATLAAATATPTPTRTATPAPATATSVPPTATAVASATARAAETFTGTVSANGTSQRTHTVTVTVPGTIGGSLNWGGNPNLDLFLLDPSGQQVAAKTGEGKPEQISFNATITGTYTWRVVAVRGNNASYTLTTTRP